MVTLYFFLRVILAANLSGPAGLSDHGLKHAVLKLIIRLAKLSGKVSASMFGNSGSNRLVALQQHTSKERLGVQRLAGQAR